MNAAAVKTLFQALAEAFEGRREALGELDAAVGDGDHGVAMARGFKAAAEAVSGLDAGEMGALFLAAGRALMAAVGGASGPLFASLLLEVGKAVADRTTLDLRDLATGVEGAVAAVTRLGRVQLGDKTMLDALRPAAERLRRAASEGVTLGQALAAAAEAAAEGARSTAAMTARKGRARYVEGGGRGTSDPGATSVALIFETLYQHYSSLGGKREEADQ